jgi:hypothetical protein
MTRIYFKYELASLILMQWDMFPDNIKQVTLLCYYFLRGKYVMGLLIRALLC